MCGSQPGVALRGFAAALTPGFVLGRFQRQQIAPVSRQHRSATSGRPAGSGNTGMSRHDSSDQPGWSAADPARGRMRKGKEGISQLRRDASGLKHYGLMV